MAIWAFLTTLFLHTEPADLHAIASEWVYSEYWTYEKEYVASCTCHAPSSGIHSGKASSLHHAPLLGILRSNGSPPQGKELVAWIGLHWDMSLGFFAVLEAFQRRGLS